MIGNVFGRASEDMRDFGQRSDDRVQEGELAVGETSMTDRLVDALASSLKKSLDEITNDLVSAGADVALSFEAVKPSGEVIHGADIGIRVSIETPGFVTTKAILVQCKRMFDASGKAPKYSEIRDRGEKQAEKMLRITPASFFMLYSSLPQEQMLSLAGAPLSLTCPVDGSSLMIRHSGSLEQCALWKHTGPLWDMGIAMLPATRVLALSAGAVLQESLMPVDAVTILPGAWPLGAFIVDLLGSCMVGDPRSEVVRIATPTRRWAREVATVGVQTSEDFDGFAVRHIIDLHIQSAESP